MVRETPAPLLLGELRAKFGRLHPLRGAISVGGCLTASAGLRFQRDPRASSKHPLHPGGAQASTACGPKLSWMHPQLGWGQCLLQAVSSAQGPARQLRQHLARARGKCSCALRSDFSQDAFAGCLLWPVSKLP